MDYTFFFALSRADGVFFVICLLNTLYIMKFLILHCGQGLAKVFTRPSLYGHLLQGGIITKNLLKKDGI